MITVVSASPFERAVVTYSWRITSSMLARTRRVKMAVRATPRAMVGKSRWRRFALMLSLRGT